jgi:hypothetical protein
LQRLFHESQYPMPYSIPSFLNVTVLQFLPYREVIISIICLFSEKGWFFAAHV